MKKNKYFIYALLGLLLLTSCEKEDGIRIKSSDKFVSPQITEPLTSIILHKENETDTVKFFWSKADYGVKLAVQYDLQAVKTGNSFNSPTTILTATLDSAIIKVRTLNTLFTSMGLTPDVASAVDFRLRSFVPNGTINGDTLYSDILTLLVAPYTTSLPPIYMIGGIWGWDPTKAVEVRSSAPFQYSTIANFTNGGIFRFFETPSWGATQYNYNYFTTVSPLLELNPADGDNNLKFVGTTGYYEISVNLQTKVITMNAVSEPVMYMTGGALGGWDWTTNYVQMTWVSNGIFEATTDFANGESFRFFAQPNWGTSYNYLYFAEGTISNLFENANDDDKNFRFVGTTGSYKITMNMLDKIVSMEASK